MNRQDALFVILLPLFGILLIIISFYNLFSGNISVELPTGRILDVYGLFIYGLTIIVGVIAFEKPQLVRHNEVVLTLLFLFVFISILPFGVIFLNADYLNDIFPKDFVVLYSILTIYLIIIFLYTAVSILLKIYYPFKRKRMIKLKKINIGENIKINVDDRYCLEKLLLEVDTTLYLEDGKNRQIDKGIYISNEKILHLYLNSMNLLAIPKSIKEFPNLNEVYMCNNNISSLEGIENLLHLKWIDLSYNLIAKCQIEEKKFPKYVELHNNPRTNSK